SEIITVLRLDKCEPSTNGEPALVPVLRQAKRECDRAQTARFCPKSSRPRDRDRRDAQATDSAWSREGGYRGKNPAPQAGRPANAACCETGGRGVPRRGNGPVRIRFVCLIASRCQSRKADERYT